jgi:hypothetical protein
MPIRPENRHRYPPDWKQISERIRFERAKGRCECRGECRRHITHLGTDGRCISIHGQPAPITGVKVILTTAHLDHRPENCDDDNLLAMCQACHLHYDRDHHAETRRQTEAKVRAEQMESLW